jgi:small subunit ribosomal protein S16
MATRIRLRRMGRKKHPTYRIVVADKTAPRDGKFIESIGNYEPQASPVVLNVDRDKALHWISEGAVPSDTVKSLMRKAGVFKPAEEAPVVIAVAEPVAEPVVEEAAAEEVVVAVAEPVAEPVVEEAAAEEVVVAVAEPVVEEAAPEIVAEASDDPPAEG